MIYNLGQFFSPNGIITWDGKSNNYVSKSSIIAENPKITPVVLISYPTL